MDMEINLFGNIVLYVLQDGEAYMNKDQLAYFKSRLLQWKLYLEKDLDRTVHMMQDEVTIFADPNDRATQESDVTLELRNRDRDRKLIKKVEESLEKIEQGDYGYCESCGSEIGFKRMEARPIATMCVDCKTLEEIREKQVMK